MRREKKHTKNIHHEYTTTKQLHAGVWFRLSNIFVLLLMLCLEKLFDIEFGEYIYMLVFSAIVGYDVAGIIEFINKFVGKRKRA